MAHLTRAAFSFVAATFAAAFLMSESRAQWTEVEDYVNDVAGDFDGATEPPADLNDPPVVSIIAPESGAIVSGNVTIDIDALDPDAQPDPLAVYWSLDGAPWEQVALNEALGLYRVIWDSTSSADADHFISVKASDGEDSAFDDIFVTSANDEAPQPASLHIAAIQLVALVEEDRGRWGSWRPIVAIDVRDNTGNPVASATITVRWDGAIKGKDECATGSGGSCMVSKKANGKDSVATLSVESVSHASIAYSPTDNALSSITIRN